MENILSRGWQITPEEIRAVQENVWQVRTDEGLFALKRSLLKENNLRFICRAENSLPPHGFTRFAPLRDTATGQPYYRENNGLFTLHPWISGEHCDFDHASHLFAAAATLGDFHLRSREKALRLISPGRADCFSRAERLNARIGELHRFYLLAEKEPQKEFSKLYRHYYPPFTAKAVSSLKALLNSAYPRLAAEAAAVGSFIHYDVAARNFVMRNREAYLIDFDYCRGDVPLTDLMRLTKRALKRGEDYETKIDALCRGYRQYRSLTRDEAQVLCALLLFPQKFWRLSHRYFCEERNNPESFYVKKMRAAAEELEKEDIWLAALKEKLKVR